MLRKIFIQVGWVIVLTTINVTASSQSKVVVVPLGSSDTSDSSEVLYGRAASSADLALLFEWPDTGVEVRTHDGDAGDAIFEIRIVNTNPSGGPSFRVTNTGSSSGSLNPGSSIKQGGLTGINLLLTENNGSLGRMMRLSCFANVISAADDGFMQCMGVTAGAP